MRFEFATATRIIFGEGTAATLPDLARSFGTRPLVVTGASPERTESLVAALSTETFRVAGEPTVEMVREGARHAQDAACDVVISIGGGSVIDAGKAIAIIATTEASRSSFLRLWEKVAPSRSRHCPSSPCRPRPALAAKSHGMPCWDRPSTASKRVCEARRCCRGSRWSIPS